MKKLVAICISDLNSLVVIWVTYTKFVIKKRQLEKEDLNCRKLPPKLPAHLKKEVI